MTASVDKTGTGFKRTGEPAIFFAARVGKLPDPAQIILGLVAVGLLDLP